MILRSIEGAALALNPAALRSWPAPHHCPAHSWAIAALSSESSITSAEIALSERLLGEESERLGLAATVAALPESTE